MNLPPYSTTEMVMLSLAVSNLAATLWTLLRACQTWHRVKAHKLGSDDDDA